MKYISRCKGINQVCCAIMRHLATFRTTVRARSSILKYVLCKCALLHFGFINSIAIEYENDPKESNQKRCIYYAIIVRDLLYVWINYKMFSNNVTIINHVAQRGKASITFLVRRYNELKTFYRVDPIHKVNEFFIHSSAATELFVYTKALNFTSNGMRSVYLSRNRPEQQVVHTHFTKSSTIRKKAENNQYLSTSLCSHC